MAAEVEVKKVEEDSKKSTGITDFLVAPKKKRKNYVILAFGENFDSELARAIESHVRSQYPHLAVAMPKSPNDLNRLFAKLVSLLIVFDEFYGSLEKTLTAVAAAKKKKGSDGVPALFLTHNAEALVDRYHHEMLTHHESDEFMALRNVSMPVLQMRVRSALRGAAKRRSRRFEFNFPITYYDVGSDKIYRGQIVDVSLHGALLKNLDGKLFKLGDQIRINLNASKVMKPSEGEFLKISARVQRVYISGNQAGVSFEYTNERQINTLTDLLSIYMKQQMASKRATIQIPKRPEEEKKR